MRLKAICTLLICSVLLCLSACNQKSIQEDVLITLDTHIAIKTKKEIRLSEIAESIEYVKLETTPESLISNGTFLVGEKYIVYCNRNPAKVILFNREGKYIREIGTVGKGPGEFMYPIYMELDSDENRLLVESYEPRSNKLFEFNIQGELLKTGSIPSRSEGGLKYTWDNKFIYMQDRYMRDSLDYPRIICLDDNFSNPKVLHSINIAVNPDQMQVYHLRNLFSRGELGFNYRDCLSDTLYSIDENFQLKPNYILSVGENKPPYDKMTIKEWDSYSNNVEIINELKGYLLMTARVNGKRHYLAYNKLNEDFFSIETPKQCDGSDGHGLRDDLMGTGPYWKWDGADMKHNSFYDQLELVDLKELVKTECFNNDQGLKTTVYRDDLKKIVEGSSIEDNPIIRIIKLR